VDNYLDYPIVWIACPSCGKERSKRGPLRSPEPSDGWLDIMSQVVCHACEMDLMLAEDRCPELVNVGRLATTCALGWAHQGRCEPTVTEEEILEARNDG
jgi:hypothetical protein